MEPISYNIVGVWNISSFSIIVCDPSIQSITNKDMFRYSMFLTNTIPDKVLPRISHFSKETQRCLKRSKNPFDAQGSVKHNLISLSEKSFDFSNSVSSAIAT